MNLLVRSLLALAVLTCSGVPAFAYVGPGAGLSLLGAFWGLLVAIFAAFAFVLLWPIRRLIRRRRGSPAGAAQPETAEAAEGSLLSSDQRSA